MRILILGGTRFIGVHLVDRLTEKGHDVMIFHRGKTPNTRPCIIELLGDRDRIEEFIEPIRAFQPDVLIDMFAYTEASAIRVIAAMRGVVDNLVLVSSCDVYRAFGRLIGTELGRPEPIPIFETSALRENWYPYRAQTDETDWRYHYDKIPTERLFLDSGMKVRVLRLPMVYGPLDYQRRMGLLIRPILDGRPHILLSSAFAKWRVTRSFVGDVAEALALAAETPFTQSQVFNVGEATAHNTLEWTSAIAEACGWEGRIVCVGNDALPELPRDSGTYEQDLALDSSAIRTELGYAEPNSWRDAIKTTAEWEVENAQPPAEDLPHRYAAEDAVISSMN